MAQRAPVPDSKCRLGRRAIAKQRVVTVESFTRSAHAIAPPSRRRRTSDSAGQSTARLAWRAGIGESCLRRGGRERQVPAATRRSMREASAMRHHSAMKRRIPRGVTTVGRRCAGLALTLLAIAAARAGQCRSSASTPTAISPIRTSLALPGQAGRTIDLPKAEAREDTSAWEAAARDARVVNGMPKRWVLRARRPIEIRPASPREDATEVWRYAAKDGALLVGFAGSNVVWVRNEAVRTPAPASAFTAPARNPAATSPRAARRIDASCIAGRFCEHVFAEIGAADREEPLAPPSDAAGRHAGAGRQALRVRAAGRRSARCARYSAASAARSRTSSGPWCDELRRRCRAATAPRRLTASACAWDLLDRCVERVLTAALDSATAALAAFTAASAFACTAAMYFFMQSCQSGHFLVPASHPEIGTPCGRDAGRVSCTAIASALPGDCASAAPARGRCQQQRHEDAWYGHDGITPHRMDRAILAFLRTAESAVGRHAATCMRRLRSLAWPRAAIPPSRRSPRIRPLRTRRPYQRRPRSRWCSRPEVRAALRTSAC